MIHIDVTIYSLSLILLIEIMRDLPKHRLNNMTVLTTSSVPSLQHQHHSSIHNKSSSSMMKLSTPMSSTCCPSSSNHNHSHRRSIMILFSFCIVSLILLTNQVQFVWRAMSTTWEYNIDHYLDDPGTVVSSSLSSSVASVWPLMEMIEIIFTKSRTTTISSSNNAPSNERRLVVCASNGRNYQFFCSTFCRPNLIYSVVPKPDHMDSTIEIMANFIKTKYPHDAGIVYTFSKKDADTVADALCEVGVIAKPYHNDVNAPTKEAVHKSWMRNETQVVVANIAFGLGINKPDVRIDKPDVRFVLHLSTSKTLETYYQESGCAGCDGNPSKCVLLYNPKDVFRMLEKVHGTSSEHLFWPMVRYAQLSGNDAVCKVMLLTHLGEPNTPDLMQVVSENEGISTERRDVGKHAKTVVELLHLRVKRGKKVTTTMLVKDWQNTGDEAEQCVKNNPPKKDGLTRDDCERIVVSLLLEKVILTNPNWIVNDTGTVINLVLGELGPSLLSSTEPKFVVHLPLREGGTTKAAAATLQLTKVKRKSAPTTGIKTKTTKKIKEIPTKKTTPKAASKVTAMVKPGKEQSNKTSNKIVKFSSDDNDTEPNIHLASLKQVDEPDPDKVLCNDDKASDDEYEFEE